MLHPRFPIRCRRRTSAGFTAWTALSLTIGSLLGARAQALTLIPLWDSSITNDSNAARIEADINNVITTYYEADFSNNVTLSVTIKEDGTVGGAYNNPIYAPTKTYAQTIDALQSHASTMDNVAILSNVSLLGNNPLTGNGTGFRMELALAAALGLNGTTTSVTTGSMTLGLTAGAAVNDNYVKQLFTHEMNEEMGTVSGIGDSAPNIIDLSRYSASGVRTYTTSTAVHASFSADGVNIGPEYFQYYASGVRPSGYDYGDFNSTHLVQGYATGAYIPTVERRMLNVAGYTYTGPTVMNQPPFPTSNTLFTLPISTASTAGGAIPNASGNDVQITEGGGSGIVTLGSSTTVVNTLVNMATATAVTINLAGQHLVAGNGAVDAGAGLIEVGASATAMTIGASANDGTVTAGSSGAYTLGLISANPASALDIRSAIVNNAGGGAVSVIVLNTGTVIMEGTNTYSGTTTIGSGATLQVGNAGATGSLGGGAIEVDGSLLFNRAGSLTVGGALSGAGPITQGGLGTVIFTGNNAAYSGAFTINSGATLQFGNGGTTGDAGAGTVANNGTLIFNRSDNLTLSSAVTGAGTLTQAGAGVLTATNISAANVTVQAGVLQFAGSLNYTGGATIQGGAFQLAGASKLGGGIYSTAITDNGTLQYSSTANQTFAGAISGSGGLTKDTAQSVLTLTQMNTYLGATTVNAGTLALNFSASGAPVSNIVSTSSALALGNGMLTLTGASGASNTQDFASTKITGTLGSMTLLQNGAAGLDVNLGPLTFNAGATLSFNGATGAAIGARLLTTTGSRGALLQPGVMYDGTDWAAKDATNTYIVAYTGYATVATGTAGSQSVVIPDSASADVKILENGSAGSPNTLASSTTTIDSLLMSAGTTASTISMPGKNLIINSASGGVGAVAIVAGAKALTVGSTANEGFISAGVSGASTLSLINNSSSALTLNSAATDNAGSGAVTLSVSGSGTVVLSGTNTFTGNTGIDTGATLQIAGAGALGSGAYAGAISANGALRYSSTAAQTLSGIISGPGSLTKDTGAGTLTLTGANTYAGDTAISAGTLQIGGAGALGTGTYAGAISVASGSTLNDASSAAQTLSGAISGAGSITNTGSSVLTVSGTNTFTGTYTVNSGTLVFGSAASVGGSGAKLAVTAGGTVDLNGLNIGTAYSATAAGTGVSGAGAIVNNGTAKAYLANVALTADTTLAPGVQSILLGSITSTQGSLSLAGYTLTMNGTGTLILNGLSMTGAGNIIVNTGTLQFMDDYGSSGSTQQTTTISGTGTITVNSGASLLTPRWTHTLTITMPIALNGGTLGSAYPGPDGATIASNISLTASSAFNFNGGGYGNVTLSGIISGGTSSVLTVTGDTATRTLTGANTYTGNTTISNGTFAIGGAGSLNSGAYAGAISLAQGTTFKYASTAAQTLSGPITGSGALTQAGSGTLTVSGNDASFTGATTVSSGTLLVSGSISGSAATVASNAVIGGTGTLGATSILSGGTILPGTSSVPGLLGTGIFSLASGGHLSLELGGVTGTGTSATLYSELNVNGTIALGGDVKISLLNGYTPNIGDTFYVILNGAGGAVGGAFSNAPGGMLSYGGIQYQVGYQASVNSTVNDVSLTVLAVPEPNASLLALSGLALAAGFRRPRRDRR